MIDYRQIEINLNGKEKSQVDQLYLQAYFYSTIARIVDEKGVRASKKT